MQNVQKKGIEIKREEIKKSLCKERVGVGEREGVWNRERVRV